MIEKKLELQKTYIQKRVTLSDSISLIKTKEKINTILDKYKNAKHYLQEANFYLSKLNKQDVIGVTSSIVKQRAIKYFETKKYDKALLNFDRYLDSVSEDTAVLKLRIETLGQFLYTSHYHKEKFKLDYYKYDTSYTTNKRINTIANDCILFAKDDPNYWFWYGSIYYSAGQIFETQKKEYWSKAKKGLETFLISNPNHKNTIDYLRVINE
jgi:tetratricopeptide (TPR) repeat protein